jgi:hypothetical protein
MYTEKKYMQAQKGKRKYKKLTIGMQDSRNYLEEYIWGKVPLHDR